MAWLPTRRLPKKRLLRRLKKVLHRQRGLGTVSIGDMTMEEIIDRMLSSEGSSSGGKNVEDAAFGEITVREALEQAKASEATLSERILEKTPRHKTTLNQFLVQSAVPGIVLAEEQSPGNKSLGELTIKEMVVEAISSRKEVLAHFYHGEEPPTSTGPVLANVARFIFCEDVDCILPGPHLLVHTATCSLMQGNAKAISYAWGASNREQRCLGHYAGGALASIELGEEWIVHDVVRTLVRISSMTDTGYCWMDQFCVNQSDDAELGHTLARIPEIFRKFDVVVVFPGGVCSCWLDDYNRFHGSKMVGDEDAESYEAISCPRNQVFAHWLSRLWTRQELQFSSSIQAYWTAKPLKHDRGEWTKQLCNGEYVDDLRTRMEYAVIESCSAWLGAANAISNWLINRSGSTDNLNQYITEFITGAPLKGQKQSSDIQWRIKTFFEALREISRFDKQTKQAQDLVLAVWIDPPGYIIPRNCKRLSLEKLLEDASEQLVSSQSIFASVMYPCVTLPAGLFGVQTCTALWRPLLYALAGPLHGTGQVYGAFSMYSGPGVLIDRRYLLCNLWKPPMEVSTSVQLVWAASAVVTLTTEEFVGFCHRALRYLYDHLFPRLKHWTSYFGANLVYAYTRCGSRVSKDDSLRLFANGLGEITRQGAVKLLQGFVACALGIDPAAAVRLGLQLMARPHCDRKDLPIVGLAQRGFDFERETTTVKPWPIFDLEFLGWNATDTGMNISRSRPPGLCYEVVDAIDEEKRFDKRAFRIVGVWVPMEESDDLSPKDFDGYII